MKAAIVFVGLLAAVAASVPKITLDHEEHAMYPYAQLRDLQTKGAIEDTILELLECVRKILLEGGELTGGLVLDPLEAEHLDTNFEIPDVLTVNGALDNITVKGLASFKVNNIKLNIVAMKLDYNVTFEQISATGLYDIIGKLVNLVPINGKGPFKFAFEKINFSGFGRLKLKGLNLDLAELRFLPKVGAMEFKIDGLMGNPEISDLVNAMLNDLVPQILEQQAEAISTLVQQIAKEIANPILNKLTLQDILDLISGSGGGGLTC